MTSFFHTPRRWFATLKFRIVLLTVLAGMLSALGTATVILHSTQQSIERVVLVASQEDRERSASLLGSKASVLRDTLAAVAANIPAAAWQDRVAMGRYLMDQPALGVLFGSIFAAGTDGLMLARVESRKLFVEPLSIADRDYFQRAMRSDQPVVSEAMLARTRPVPVIIVAVPVLDRQGRHLGLLAGALSLQSTALFDEVRASAQNASIHDLVIDRSGRILAHEDPRLLLHSAEEQPGLRETVQEWIASGSPIDTRGSAIVRQGHVVSMAGIPLTDWLNVRVMTTELAMAPVAEARSAALPAAAVAGLLAGVLAGALAYRMTRPISRLRASAESLLDGDPGAVQWPQERGEVGELSRALRHVVEQKQRRQAEVQALLHQLEAVLDHTEVGIALTRHGRFELVSQHFCQIFRCDKSQAVGHATRMIYPSESAYRALVAEARPTLSQRRPLDLELELVRHNGQPFWARMRGRAVVAGDVTQGTIWTIEDVTVMREQREQLAYSASHDALTGLVNRASFERLLEEATAASAQQPFCALFIDLDRFKQVNDSGGHAAGDALLRDLAQRLAQQVRKTDTVARLGGDEFAVLLPRCPPGQARLIADQLCASVLGYELLWEGQRFSVGASIGLVQAGAEPGARFTSAAEVLRAADAACYQAKRRGRSRVELFEPAAVHGPIETGAERESDLSET